MNIKICKPTAVDLFCGCGGLTEGLKQAGFNVVGAVECNIVFVRTYKLNHKKVRVWVDDIKKLDPKKIRQKLQFKKGDLDLMAGCPPCQGFSTVGTKNVNDKRNDLVFEWLRFVKEFEPKTVMMENVKGLYEDKRITIIVEELNKIGYKTGETPKVLNVADYGVPQRRKRMILLAGKEKFIELAKRKSKTKTVRQAIGNLPLPGNSDDKIHDYPEKRSAKVMRWIEKIPKNGGSYRNLKYARQLPCHKRLGGGFKDIYGRMKWDDISPTITGGCTNPSKGRFLHPEQNRAITMREAALIQAFPASYKFSLIGGKGVISSMIGNALPPLFIKKHANKIIKHLKENHV
ncbi:DNA cytosine methyltransferase [Candidatus Parcubacteria bacterium]|nr:DNA cytosine methyltransferase [Candidatus Parcubacteria bacterium]